MLYAVSRFTAPTGWYATRDGALEARRTSISSTTTVSLDDVEVVREECTSKDGTKIPLTVLRPKGTRLDGRNPTYLTGYGGFGVSMEPRFASNARPWFDAGGVYAIAHVRGGGELGEPWHHAGNHLNKHNVIDDIASRRARLHPQ